MNLSLKKASSLDKKLGKLERERGLVAGDIKVLSKALQQGDELGALPRVKSEEALRIRETHAGDKPTPEAHDVASAEAERSEYAGKTGTSGTTRRPAAGSPTDGVESPWRLRHERHVQRNRAILMMALALGVAFVVARLVL